MPIKSVGRFAPSTTGHAHPGTLLAALLAWADIRSRAGRFVLRFEDLDPERCKQSFTDTMRHDLEELGLDWDDCVIQSTRAERYAHALDRLAERDVLYACACSRQQLVNQAQHACRNHRLGPPEWRSLSQPLRVALPDVAPDDVVSLYDESGLDLSQRPLDVLGDPIVRRRDGAIAYQLAVVVDDAESQVTCIVRGRDIAESTATQVCLQRYLDFPTPTYRHHLLLLEPRGDKLAKFHGSVTYGQIRPSMAPAEIVGFLAWTAGLVDHEQSLSPRDFLDRFTWERVRATDVVVAFNNGRLARRL